MLEWRQRKNKAHFGKQQVRNGMEMVLMTISDAPSRQRNSTYLVPVMSPMTCTILFLAYSAAMPSLRLALAHVIFVNLVDASTIFGLLILALELGQNVNPRVPARARPRVMLAWALQAEDDKATKGAAAKKGKVASTKTAAPKGKKK